MTQIAKRTKPYPSDLTDKGWERIVPLMPAPEHRSRPRAVELRELVNAGRCLSRWFLFQIIYDGGLVDDRERAGREASPSAMVTNGQLIREPQAESRSYDAPEKIIGCQRHIAIDWPSADGRPDDRRHLRPHRGAGDPRRHGRQSAPPESPFLIRKADS